MTSNAIPALHTVGIQLFEDWYLLFSLSLLQGETEWNGPSGMQERPSGHREMGRSPVIDGPLTPSSPDLICMDLCAIRILKITALPSFKWLAGLRLG